MRAEDHWDAYREHRDAVLTWALDIRGLARSQRTVGLNVSRALVELLSFVLHKRRLVDEGFQLNHRWFKSRAVSARLPDFDGKEELVGAMVALELLAEALTYGAPKGEELVKDAVQRFTVIEKRMLVLADGKA
jgi:hypothetical protein